MCLKYSNAVGETIDVVMVSVSTVKPLTEEEILHVRPYLQRSCQKPRLPHRE